MSETAVLRPPINIEQEAALGTAAIEEMLQLEAQLGLNGIMGETARLRSAVGDTSASDVPAASGLEESLSREKYNRSLRTYRQLGRLASGGELCTVDGRAARENVRRDLATSLAEMFENGEAFQGGFEISDVYNYPVIDGQVHYRTADGLKPIRQVTEEGAALSAAVAKTDPLMAPQAQRDRADVFNAARVDVMAAGRLNANTRLAVSRDLGDVIKPGSAYRDLYLGKGYRDGLSFLQLYFADGERLTAGTFSVDGVSDEVFDRVSDEFGGQGLPAGESRHNSVKYGIELNLKDRDDAISFAHRFRRRCYELEGVVRERRSATEFIQERAEEIDGYIDALCVPLAISSFTGLKQRAVHDFVSGLLVKPGHMRAEIVDHLRQIQKSEAFTDDDSRRLAGVILYAVAESLYERAKNFVLDKPVAAQDFYAPRAGLPHGQIISHLTASVHVGVEAGRTHSGGCPGEVALGKAKDSLDPLNPQGAFGGLEGEDKETTATDKYGSMSFNCPSAKCGKKNFRNYNELRERCQHCHRKIPRC